MSWNWEYFRRALLVLGGPGPVKQRLLDAYTRHLSCVDVRALPDPTAADFGVLVDALKCAKATGGLSTTEVAVRKMSEQDAARHAESVLGMFVALSATHFAETAAESANPPRLRIVGDDDELPAFLSRA